MTVIQISGLTIMCGVLIMFVVMFGMVLTDLVRAMNPKTRPDWWNRELTYWAVWNLVSELIGIFLVAGAICLGLGAASVG